MFRCDNCKKVDKFELMLSPDYRGEGVVKQSFNNKDQIVIVVDGYEFIPDLPFMNGHAVCKYCGNINSWEYFYSEGEE